VKDEVFGISIYIQYPFGVTGSGRRSTRRIKHEVSTWNSAQTVGPRAGVTSVGVCGIQICDRLRDARAVGIHGGVIIIIIVSPTGRNPVVNGYKPAIAQASEFWITA
jgi:hypothetical protein